MFAVRTLLIVAVIGLAWGTPAFADEITVDNCKVVKVDGTRLSLETAKGDKHSAEVASGATITLDGKDAKLSDLKEGTKIKVTVRKDGGTPTIQKVEASSK
jgi:Cu/Ag efflux protein CusF